jgi:hypothetical protein
MDARIISLVVALVPITAAFQALPRPFATGHAPRHSSSDASVRLQFDFGALDDDQKEMIMRALEEKERLEEEAKAAEVAEEWAELEVTLQAALESKPARNEGVFLGDAGPPLPSTNDSLSDHETEARVAAAKALVLGRSEIMDSVMDARSSTRLRLDAEDGYLLDETLRLASRRLLGVGEQNLDVDGPGEAAVIARAARLIGRRIKMDGNGASDAARAAAAHCALSQMVREMELHAWAASGGLL